MSVAMATRPSETRTGLDQLAYCSCIVRTGPYHHAPGSGMSPLPVLDELVAIDVPQVAVPDAFGVFTLPSESSPTQQPPVRSLVETAADGRGLHCLGQPPL